MTEFFEAFQPSLRFWREQRAREKQLFVDTRQAGRGRRPVDLDSGRITIEIPVEPSSADKDDQPT